MEVFYHGSCRKILFTQEAAESLGKAEQLVPTNKSACGAQLRRVLKRLGDCRELRNKELFRHEENGIYAVKARCGLRGYGWFQRMETGEDVFIVSHFVMKKRDKANRGDLQKADRTRREIQTAGESQ